MNCFKKTPALPHEDLVYLKQHTRYDESQINEWYKCFMKDFPKGQLTPIRFIDAFNMLFPNGNAKDFCAHVFRTFDLDGKGTIDFKEYVMAMDQLKKGSSEDRLKWAFKMYDADGNGSIDIDELTNIVKAIYDIAFVSDKKPTDTAEERARAIFKKMDKNSDGRITETEFIDSCKDDDALRNMLESNYKEEVKG